MAYFDTERKFSPIRLVEMAYTAHTSVFQDPAALSLLTRQIIVVRPSTPEDLADRLQAQTRS